MTCIAGLVDKGAIILGADAAGVARSSLTVRADLKVFARGVFVMGFTSSFRMGQLLRYRLSLPEHPDGLDSFEYMATAFVDSVRACLRDGGFATKNNEQESGGVFLVGYRGRLFRVESDYQIAENVCGYDACGCGQDIALGSLFSTPKKDANDRVLLALKAAEQWSTGVRRPFSLIRLDKK